MIPPIAPKNATYRANTAHGTRSLSLSRTSPRPVGVRLKTPPIVTMLCHWRGRAATTPHWYRWRGRAHQVYQRPGEGSEWEGNRADMVRQWEGRCGGGVVPRSRRIEPDQLLIVSGALETRVESIDTVLWGECG